MELVRSAAAYKHEYLTPPLPNDRFGSPNQPSMGSHNIENRNGSNMGSVPPGYALEDELPISDSEARMAPTPDIHGKNRYRDRSAVEEKEEEEHASDHDLYTRGEGSILMPANVEDLVNAQKPQFPSQTASAVSATGASMMTLPWHL